MQTITQSKRITTTTRSTQPLSYCITTGSNSLGKVNHTLLGCTDGVRDGSTFSITFLSPYPSAEPTRRMSGRMLCIVDQKSTTVFPICNPSGSRRTFNYTHTRTRILFACITYFFHARHHPLGKTPLPPGHCISHFKTHRKQCISIIHYLFIYLFSLHQTYQIELHCSPRLFYQYSPFLCLRITFLVYLSLPLLFSKL